MKKVAWVDRQKLREMSLFAFPAIAESILVVLLMLVDTYMVSHLGTAAIAAVALTSQPVKLLSLAFLGINIAVTKNVAAAMGRGDKAGAHAVVRFSLCLTLLLSVGIVAVGEVFADGIITLSGSQPGTHEMATGYFRIIMVGSILSQLSLFFNAVKRGCQNAKVSFLSNVTANVVNIFLDYLLIFGHWGLPRWGVYGAAVATVAGQFSAFLISASSLLSRKDFVTLQCLATQTHKLERAEKADFMNMVGTLVLEYCGVRVAFLLISVMTAHIGTDEFAVDKVAMTFLEIVFCFGSGIQAAAIAKVGNSLGARKEKDAHGFAVVALQMGAVIAVFLALGFALGGKMMFSLYFIASQKLIDYGGYVAILCAWIVLFQIPQLILNGILKGMGDVQGTLRASLFSVLLVQVPLSYFLIFVCDMGLRGKWIASLIGQACWCLMLLFRFLCGRYRNKKLAP